jgi:hypothetical protein
MHQERYNMYISKLILATTPPVKRILFMDLIITLDGSSATGSSAFSKTQQFIIMMLQVMGISTVCIPRSFFIDYTGVWMCHGKTPMTQSIAQ